MKSFFSKNLLIKVVLFIALLVVFVFAFLCSPSLAINKATKLLSEYKTAEALDILLKAQDANHGRDERLNFLVVYALTKSNLYDQALEKIDTVKSFPNKNQKEITNFLKFLSLNDKNELLIRSLQKSLSIDLNQDFLIGISKQRRTSEEEINFLEASLAYLKQKKQRNKFGGKKQNSKQLEEYLLERYMEASKLQRANQNHKLALDYLLRAKNLEILEESQQKDDYYYNLGVSYKESGLTSKAWDALNYSASLGNSKAQDIINQAKHKYVPPQVLIEDQEPKSEDYSFNTPEVL